MTEQAFVARNAVNLKQLPRLRRRLIEILGGFIGQDLSGEAFAQFVSEFYGLLPSSTHYPSFSESIRYLAGSKMTLAKLEEVVWRLTGNSARLRQHRLVLPWAHQPFLEWVPSQIIRVERANNPYGRDGRRGRVGWDISFRVLAGLCCPVVITQWWSTEKCYALNREFSFSRRKGPNSDKPALYPFTSPQQLTLLLAQILIDPKLSGEDPGFEKLRFPLSMSNWNKATHKRRKRVEFSCPEAYPDSYPCWQCWVGWDSCPAGTQKESHIFRECEQCSKTEAPHDPELDSQVCLNCYLKNLLESTYGSSRKEEKATR